jgi:hypothetical protein
LNSSEAHFVEQLRTLAHKLQATLLLDAISGNMTQQLAESARFRQKREFIYGSLLNVKNLIIAGNTLSQKEYLVDSFLVTLLLPYTPSELRFVLNDPTHYLDLY